MAEPEVMYAVRRTDGETIGDEFTFLVVHGEGDARWNDVEDYDEEDAVEYELLRFEITVEEKRTVGGPKPLCTTWAGYENAASTRWCVVLPAKSDGLMWPRRPMNLEWFDTAEECDAYIAGLPDLFHMFQHGIAPQPVEKRRLVIVPSDHPAYVSSCRTCGHAREDHQAMDTAHAGG